MEPKVTSSSGHVDPAILAARDMMKSTDLPIAPMGQKSWVQFEYPEPHTIDAVTVAMGGPRDPLAQFAERLVMDQWWKPATTGSSSAPS